MPILAAYTLPHPPLAVPAVGRGQESEISETIEAMDKVACEIAKLAPETIIYVTPHSTVYSDYFHISPGHTAHGDLGRFRCMEERFKTQYDEQLINEISRVAELNDISAGTQGERDASLDHGVTVPMWYINRRYTGYRSIRVSQSGMAPSEHYMLGQVIKNAAETIGRKVVLIASSDLSHKLKKDAPYGFADEGPEFDAIFTGALAKGDFLSLLKIPDDLRSRAAECGYNSLMVLAGCFDRQDVDAKLLSYEGPFGVGYAVASFTSMGENERRNILEQYIDYALEESEEKRSAEDRHQKLARESLEHIIRTGDKLPVPNALTDELLNERAGVFVSIHKNGRLRGCIGTIMPTTPNVAQEIIQNAISAGLSDNRFDPVSIDELPYLVYKVDVLLSPEPISGPEELDVKRYGVIVTSGVKRGLLLPNLDGIDTVAEQLEIAKQKGGIRAGENVSLERFEVIRHG
ncbi:MAG: AmmeMemoRadiSam system protein A [Oscillospiraceae bacterium]|nr:AmmeMemoRadiSam system protein A [Oscillospiraceae bacterium]